MQERFSELDAIVAAATGNGVPRLFLTEMDYERALVEADCAFTEQLARDIESERLDGVTFWKSFHAERRTTATSSRGEGRHMNAIVEVEGIARSFGETKALCAASTSSVPEGGVVALLGPNGAGKTTLVRILSTLIEPDAGTARVAGLRRGEAADRGAPLHRHSPGSTPPSTRRSPVVRTSRWSVGCRDCRRSSRPSARPRCSNASASPTRPTASSRPTRAACADASTSVPGSSRRPRVLLLDEPTTGLDPANRLDLWAYLRDLVNEGATILLTTQYLEEADQLASDVVVIDHGAVIAHGTPTRAEATARRRRARRDRRRRGARPRRRAARRRRFRTADRRPRHSAGVAPGRRRRREPGARRSAGSTSTGIKVSTSRCAARRSTTCSSPSPATPPTAYDTDDADPPEASLMTDHHRPRPHAGRRPTPPSPTDCRAAPRSATRSVIAGRNVKHLLRTPQLLVASVAQTVMFLLLFRYVFGGSIQIPGMTFVDFLIPGYLATIAIFDGFGVSIFFAEDSKSGLIERFRALPMARSAVVGGRAIADLLRQAALLAITTVVGVAVGFGFAGSFGGIVLAYVIAFVWGFALFWVFAAIGLFVRDAETAQAASTPFFILVFVSSAIIDVNTLPGLVAAVRPQPAAEPGVQRDARVDGRQRGRGAGRALDQPLRAHVVHLVRGDHRGVRAVGDLRVPTSLRSTSLSVEATRGCPSWPARFPAWRRARRGPGACRSRACRGRARSRPWPDRP